MTIGSDAIGALPIGAEGEDVAPALVYEPISRVIPGGWSNPRPAEVVFLGVGIIWEDGSIIAWEDDSGIAWG